MLKSLLQKKLPVVVFTLLFVLITSYGFKTAEAGNLSQLKLIPKFNIDINASQFIKMPILTVHVPFDIKNWPVAWRNLPLTMLSYVSSSNGNIAVGITEKAAPFKSGNFLGVMDVILDLASGPLSDDVQALAIAYMKKGDMCIIVGVGHSSGQVGSASGMAIPCNSFYADPTIEDLMSLLTDLQ